MLAINVIIFLITMLFDGYYNGFQIIFAFNFKNIMLTEILLILSFWVYFIINIVSITKLVITILKPEKKYNTKIELITSFISVCIIFILYMIYGSTFRFLSAFLINAALFITMLIIYKKPAPINLYNLQGNIENKLQLLKDMKERGLISEEDYNNKKNDILKTL